MMNKQPTPAALAFASSTLSIIEHPPIKKLYASTSPTSPDPIIHKTRAYYRDSSGRARVHLRLRLTVPSSSSDAAAADGNGVDGVDGDNGEVGGAEALIECGCIKPSPVESDTILAAIAKAKQEEKEEEDAKKNKAEQKDGAQDDTEKEDEDNNENEDNVDDDDDDSMWQEELATIGRNNKGEEIPSPWYTDTTFTFECCTVQPSPTNNEDHNDDNDNDNTISTLLRRNSANSNNNNKSNHAGNTTNNNAKPWALEGVTILYCQIQRSSPTNPKSSIVAFIFDIEVAVGGQGVVKQTNTITTRDSIMRYNAGDTASAVTTTSNTNNAATNNNTCIVELLEEGELELRAVLRQRQKYREDEKNDEKQDTNNSRHNTNGNVATAKSLLLGGGPDGSRNGGGGIIAAGLLGLELGGGSLSPAITSRGALTNEPYSLLSSSTRRNNDDNNHKNKNKNKNMVEIHYDTKISRTSPPLLIHATLIPPLQLTVREVCGARAASGSTLVEITVEHSSQWHMEDVTVTGIAFHPGQSRLWDTNTSGLDDDDDDDDYGEDDGPEGGDGMGGGGGGNNHDNKNGPNGNNAFMSAEGKSMQGGELSVIDMSRRVRWGFAPGSAPELPLILGPYEAFATVIQIDAGEDVRSRAFFSPISVNAVMGDATATTTATNIVGGGKEEKGGERIMVTADTRWTSSRVGVENSDAFRIDMSLRGGHETVCRVGAPLVVSLRVLNLSMEPRDLMLLMAKDGEGRNSGLQWERPVDGRRRRVGGSTRATTNREQLLHQTAGGHAKENHSFNTAVVSEVNGYTFGVWGLSGDDDGTTRHHRDHELLAVDAALLLGEVKGQHSIEAELRFVPLREGTLDVPNLKLYDKRGMKWYNCVHTLKIVARQSN